VLTELLPVSCFALFSAHAHLMGDWSCGAQSSELMRIARRFVSSVTSNGSNCLAFPVAFAPTNAAQTEGGGSLSRRRVGRARRSAGLRKTCAGNILVHEITRAISSMAPPAQSQAHSRDIEAGGRDV
jgi:hypothetical protein